MRGTRDFDDPRLEPEAYCANRPTRFGTQLLPRNRPELLKPYPRHKLNYWLPIASWSVGELVDLAFRVGSQDSSLIARKFREWRVVFFWAHSSYYCKSEALLAIQEI